MGKFTWAGILLIALAGLLCGACAGKTTNNIEIIAVDDDDDASPPSDDDVSPDDDFTPSDDDVSPGETLVWVQVTDDHQSRGSCDNKGHYAAWLAALQYLHDVMKPDFVVNTGDLADNECPIAQHQDDWDDYHDGVVNAGYTSADYYDVVGNHDAHKDPDFTYYLANSVSGADGKTMHAWTRKLGRRTYGFIATLTATSATPRGDFSQAAYDWTETQLKAANDDTNVFVFAHHPDVGFTCERNHMHFDAGLFGDGGLLDKYHVTSFVGGHVHLDCERAEWNSYMVTTYNEYHGEEFLAPDHSGRMRVFALTGPIWANRPKWIVNHGSQVIITYPQDERLAVPRSPYGHIVSGLTTIAAMAFTTSSAPADLEMAIDDGDPTTMTSADGRTFFATFDFDSLAKGEHSISVQDANNADESNGTDEITVVSQ